MGDVHEGKWDGSPGRFTLEEWHRSCLVHLHGPGMPEGKGQCKLPIRDPDGKINRHGVHAAAARLNQVDAPPDKIARARSALRAAYRECGEEAPIVAKAGGDRPFRDEEGPIEKRRRVGGSGIRRVRTPEGARYYDAPIGTPITAAMKVAARHRNRGRGTPRGEGSTAPPSRQGGRGPAAAPNARSAPNMRGANARPPREVVPGGLGYGYGQGQGRGPKGRGPNDRGPKTVGTSQARRPPGSAALPDDPKERAKVYGQAVNEAQTEEHLELILQRLNDDDVVTDRDYDLLAGAIGNRALDMREAKGGGKTPVARKPVAPPPAPEAKKPVPPPPPPPEKKPEPKAEAPKAEPKGRDELYDDFMGRIDQAKGEDAAQVLAQVREDIKAEKGLGTPDKKTLLARAAKREKQAVTPAGEPAKVQPPKQQAPGSPGMATASPKVRAIQAQILAAGSYGDIDRALTAARKDKSLDPGDVQDLVDLGQRREGDFAFVGEIDMQMQIGDADIEALRKRVAERDWLVDADRANIVAAIEIEAKKTEVVRKYVSQARQAKDESDIQKIALSAMSDKALSKRQQNQVAVALEDQLAFIEGYALDPALRKRIMRRKSDDAASNERRWANDPDASPAAKELARGVALDKVKNPDGMLDYVLAHPEKYEVQVIDKGQQSSAWSVTEKGTGTKHFFKQATNNNSGHMYGDGVNEYMAAQFGRAVFDDVFLGVDFAAPPVDGKNPVVRMTHAEEWAKQHGGTDVRFDGRGRDPEVDLVADPKQPMTIHIFDYLINQQDRHADNFGWMKTDQGVVLIPMDNGGSFYGHKAVAENEPVEGIDYGEWVRRHPKGRSVRNEANLAYKGHGISDEQMIADVEEIIERFRQVDADKILADLLKRFPDMDAYEREHAEAAVMVFLQRLDLIEADEVVAMVKGTL